MLRAEWASNIRFGLYISIRRDFLSLGALLSFGDFWSRCRKVSYTRRHTAQIALTLIALRAEVPQSCMNKLKARLSK